MIVVLSKKRNYKVTAYRDLFYWECVVGAHDIAEAEYLARLGMGIPKDVSCWVEELDGEKADIRF